MVWSEYRSKQSTCSRSISIAKTIREKILNKSITNIVFYINIKFNLIKLNVKWVQRDGRVVGRDKVGSSLSAMVSVSLL